MSLFSARQIILQADVFSPYLQKGWKSLFGKVDHINLKKYTLYLGSVYIQKKCCHNEANPGESAKKWTPAFAGSVLEKMRAEDKTFYSVSVKDVIQKLQCLSNAQLPADEIEELIRESPYFLQGKNIEPVINVLQEHGFEGRSIFDIFMSYSRITDEDPSNLFDSLMFMRKLYKTDRRFNNALTACPEMLTLTKTEINGRIRALQDLFKSDDVLDLTVRSPHIFFEDFETVQEKFDYVFHTMGISQRQMMYSDMFNYPLLHMQTRHTFLERAGFYKKIKKDKGEINTNPLLQDILRLSDKVFAKKFGNMTELDYKTFAQYFVIELDSMNE
ncbi:transcription termination factor 4, mitochondrial-like isoform X2 [Ostrea edulis]|nr:transcription termination factor 4, mitochondrial-like isoform X2 [Ostrea edulis]